MAYTKVFPSAMLILGPTHSPWETVVGCGGLISIPGPTQCQEKPPNCCDNHKHPTHCQCPLEAELPQVRVTLGSEGQLHQPTMRGLRWHLLPMRVMEKVGE